MELREKGIGTKRFFEGKVINLRVDTVELPDGKRSTREIVEHPGAVCIAAITEDEKIILVRQYRRPIDEVILEIPAGKLDKDEDPLACAKRELKEETGYTAEKWKLISAYHAEPGFCDHTLHLYFAQDLEGSENSLDDGEFLEVEYFSLEEAKNLVLAGKLNDAKTMIAILAVWVYLREQ